MIIIYNTSDFLFFIIKQYNLTKEGENMKNLTERIKGFFTAFWAWTIASRSLYVNVNTPEYRDALNDYLERTKDNEKDWFEDFFVVDSFCTAYVLNVWKQRRLKCRKLRHEMRNAFFRMIFFWIS